MAETKVRERERLLVDVGKQVRKDPGITINRGPSIAAGPALAAQPAVRARPKIHRPSLADAAVGTVARGDATRARFHGRATVPKPPAQIVAKLAAKVRQVVPAGGDVCFTMSHNHGYSVGHPWVNECDAPFWLASDYQVLQATYEWMNSEYEAVADSFSYCDTEPVEAPGFYEGEIINPTLEEMCEAWDMVATEQEHTIFLIQVCTRDGEDVGRIEVTAGWLLGQFGYSREDLLPVVIIADEILTEDYLALQTQDEVMLDEGYTIDHLDYGEDYLVVHILPTPTK